jgi:hypothetical protein
MGIQGKIRWCESQRRNAGQPEGCQDKKWTDIKATNKTGSRVKAKREELLNIDISQKLCHWSRYFSVLSLSELEAV